MSRRSGSAGKSAPTYRLHKPSGNAIVTINGRLVYLGKHGTDESQEKYRQVIAEQWNPRGKLARITKPPEVVTITTLAVEYAKHAKGYYQKNRMPTSEWAVVQIVLKRFRSIYGSSNAAEFGPLRYQTFRQLFIDDDLARSTINHYCWIVRQVFRHGGRNELVPMSLYRDLDAVGNLLEGRSKARETDDVVPVEQEIVNATSKELNPILASMVRLQLLTGMRPGEVRNLRPCDVDRAGDVWKYKPPTHKNEHKKSRKAKTRIICFGPLAQKLLRPYLLRDHQAFCFSPLEAEPGRAKKPMYSKDAFARAIKRAGLRANPYPEEIEDNETAMKQWRKKYCWCPNQLRHSAATLARKHGGIETAQQVLGHTQTRTTELNYAEIDDELAVEFARKFG